MTPRLTKAPGGLDYARCKRGELDEFYKARANTKTVPKHTKNKGMLIQVLRRMDKKPGVFRFSDLPAEIRNFVYSDLLHVGAGKCKTGILYVSKQIHDEAAAILYGDNVPEVDIYWASIAHNQVIEMVKRRVAVKIGDRFLAETPRPAGHTLLNAGECYSRAKLSSFKRIDIKIYLYDETATAEDIIQKLIYTGNHALYGLCSALADSKALKQLDVQFLNVPKEDELEKMPQLPEVLWPLQLLPEHVSTTLHNEDNSFKIEPFVDPTWPLVHTYTVLDKLVATYNMIKSFRKAMTEAGNTWNKKLDLLEDPKKWMKGHLEPPATIGPDRHQAMQGASEYAAQELSVILRDTLKEIEEKKVKPQGNDMTEDEMKRLAVVYKKVQDVQDKMSAS